MSNDLRWPLVSNVIRRNSLSHTFGMVRRNANGTPRAHQGWDFFATVGTPCYAISDGEVVFSGENGAFGLIVVHSIEFGGKTLYAAYAHLSSSSVSRGDPVMIGDTIGRCGKSGNASDLSNDDMHLHFEIRTEPRPGLGLGGRMSPLKVFGKCPLNSPEISPISVPTARRTGGANVAAA